MCGFTSLCDLGEDMRKFGQSVLGQAKARWRHEAQQSVRAGGQTQQQLTKALSVDYSKYSLALKIPNNWKSLTTFRMELIAVLSTGSRPENIIKKLNP